MRLVTQLFLSLGALLAVALASAGFTAWNARQAEMHVDRANYAHQQYEAYLSLSNHTYRLFKQFADALLIGDRDGGAGEAALMKMIRDDLSRIRELTGREIEFVDEDEVDEEIGELDQLARIEAQLNSLLDEYREIVVVGKDIPAKENWGRLSRMLDESIDEHFNALILEALEDELGEVRATRDEADAHARLSRSLALGFGLLATAAAALALFTLIRNIRAPVARLRSGATAIERGDLGQRVDAGGPAELRELADAFNRMADEISSREAALSRTNADLERAVRERTEKLTEALDTVRRSEATRRQLLADVSHELRTPLTIIRGEAEIALRGEPKRPEVYREALEHCRESALHTARLVDDLLFVARSEGGETRLDVGKVDLAALVARVVDDSRRLDIVGGARITFASSVGDAQARADAQRVRQVLLILLDNASRYGGATVDVRLDASPGGYAVSVHDDGPGLGEDELASAFQRFFRGPNAARRYADGAGLGLPVAKAIVEAHGGRIALDSAPGEGLTATFVLPAWPRLQAVS